MTFCFHEVFVMQITGKCVFCKISRRILALFSGIAPRIHPIGRIAMKYVKEVLTQNFEYKVSCGVGLSARLRAILCGR